MWALVDCNSFFCSVERAFHPGLGSKPVCVLSSNDGCIVALTPEAKRLGLRRGDPLFKVRDIVDRGGVTLFSTNMMLYAAMSRRVTNILRRSIAHVENYSIDESFCDLRGYSHYHDLEELMRSIAQRIRLWTDIPVSVGVAPSKTLAKMGSRFAKQYAGYRSVCLIDSEEKRLKALELCPLEDVWGIGRNTLKRLQEYGIHSPLQLANQSEGWVKSRFPLPLQRTWRELNGIDCIDTSETLHRQSICTSRSFGQMVSRLEELRPAVATFATSCANKLRGQQSAARSVGVFVMSNRFSTDLPFYSRMESLLLPVHTADTPEIVQTAQKLLDQIYRPGVHYKKAGVILGDILPLREVQPDLFDPLPNRMQRYRLMQTIDSLNRRYGTHTVQLAALGNRSDTWTTKCEQRSPNYLTDLNELLTVH